MRRLFTKQTVLMLLLLIAAPALHADFIINYTDAAGNGFYDATYGASRRASFEWATSQWNRWLGGTDPVPIRISTGWAALGTNVLGQSQSTSAWRRDFSGATVANTWYGDSLADRLHGSDLGGGAADMTLMFSTGFTSWNYNYTLADGQFGGLYDFSSVAMHEVGHGMGLWSTFNSTGLWGQGTGYPNIYDRYLEYQNGTDLLATTPPMDVTENPGGTGAADNGIYWSGAHATAGNGGTRVELYAPPTFASGSSLSHIDASTSPDRLMNYSIGTNNERRTIDPLTTGMLLDIGWQGAGSATPEPGSFLLLGLAVGPILALRRRKQQAKRKAA